jgi:hypothetical protein
LAGVLKEGVVKICDGRENRKNRSHAGAREQDTCFAIEGCIDFLSNRQPISEDSSGRSPCPWRVRPALNAVETAGEVVSGSAFIASSFRLGKIDQGRVDGVAPSRLHARTRRGANYPRRKEYKTFIFLGASTFFLFPCDTGRVFGHKSAGAFRPAFSSCNAAAQPLLTMCSASAG